MIGNFGLNLIEVTLSNNYLSTQFQFKHLSSSFRIEKLVLSNCGINILSVWDLSSYWYLKHLDLSFNQIVFINDAFLNLQYRLETFNLSHNNITRINGKTFQSQINLAVLDLSFNPIETIADNTFAQLTQIAYLDMSFARIKYLSQGMFGDNFCTQLTQFFMNNNNNLKTIDFQMNTFFYVLHLNGNQLKDIPISITNNIKWAVKLNINDNLVQTVSPEQFKLMTGIEELSLARNSIANIESGSFINLNLLLNLDISGNRLTTLDRGMLTGLVSLNFLNLSSNRLEVIRNDSFFELSQLKNLDLSSNMITDVSVDLFSGLRHLKVLFLNGNLVNHLFREGLLKDLDVIKFLFIDRAVFVDEQVCVLIKSELKVKLVKQVLDFTYFDSINIVAVSGQTRERVPYSDKECEVITFLIRNRIQMSLYDDESVASFVSECQDWASFFYQNYDFFYIDEEIPLN
jgi:Leucine-rich repeat (LRR) protein